MKSKLAELMMNSNASVRDVIERMDRGQIGAIVIATEDGRFENIITDGDVRRGILKGIPLSETAAGLLRLIKKGDQSGSITGSPAMSRDEMLSLMIKRVIRHLPILETDGRIIDLVFLPELIEAKTRGFDVLILAGGLGMRLRPLTENTPKPMLPLGDRPIIEIMIRRMYACGSRRFYIATHYLADQIHDHLARLELEGLSIEYIREDAPLGTGGALRRIEDWSNPKLVFNADIVTEVDFEALKTFHDDQKPAITLAVRSYHVDIPYGVVETADGRATRLSEKPSVHYFVNAGIYVVDQSALAAFPVRQKFDMTDVVQNALERGLPVATFPVHEYWLDIGQPRDYQRAQDDIRDGRIYL